MTPADLGPRSVLLVDANELLFWVAGVVSPRLLSTFGRVRHLPRAAHPPLLDALARCGRVVTLPHVLAEAGNLAGKLPAGYRRPFFLSLIGLLEGPLEELPLPRRRAEECGELFPRLGLTDALILVAAAGDVTAVLTEDRPLGAELRARSVGVLTLRGVADTQCPPV